MGKFQPGQSGNPTGRKPGIVSATHMLIARVVEDPEKLALVAEKWLELALDGHWEAIRAFIDRHYPVPRGSRVRFALPEIRDAESLTGAVNAVLSGVSTGQITIEEGQELMEMLESAGRAMALNLPWIRDSVCDDIDKVLSGIGRLR